MAKFLNLHWSGRNVGVYYRTLLAKLTVISDYTKYNQNAFDGFFFTFDISEHSIFEKKWDVDKSLNDKCEKTSEKDKTA